MSNLVEIIVTAKNLTGPAMAAVNKNVEKSSAAMKTLHKTAGIAALGFAAFGVEAVKSASKFDSEMTLLQTQAGVSADKIGGLKSGVLALSGKVAQDPDSLAEALYHVESNFSSMGITSAKALKLTETAAKGATVGHANLVDVTNALTAAVAAGIPGVENLDQAMGVLNATVGAGDMKMQDLASAFSTGMVATVKGFGLSITDVGAALATFGDNNIRGAKAGTQLRMSVMALAEPVASSGAALQKLGLQTDTLAKDMQKGGLKLALEDLVAHMKAAGISSVQQGQIITDAFGRKAGAGLNILVSQMDRLESKYPELEKGAKGFGKSWEDTTKTFAFQMKQLETGFEALGISIGEKLIPPVQRSVKFLVEHREATTDSALALGGLLAAVVAVSGALKIAAGVKIAWSGMVAGAALAKGAFETLALKLLYMRDASIAAGGGLRGLSAAFGTLSTGAKIGTAVTVIGGVALALHELADSSKAAPDVDKMTTALGEFGRTGAVTGVLKDNLEGLSESIAMVSKTASDNMFVKAGSNLGGWLGITSGPSVSDAQKNIDSLDKSLASLVQGGHADLAAAASKRLEKAWIAGGGTAKRYMATMNDYQGALKAQTFAQDTAAESQGRFGKQAQQVQQQLQAQKDVADGLAQSLQALDQVAQESYDSQTKMEGAISGATQALKENGKTLSLHTEKGRANRDALSAIAETTDGYTQALEQQGASMDQVDAAYKRGYDSLVKAAEGFGQSTTAAHRLADELLHVPTEVKIGANIDDLEAQLRKAKTDLKNAPKSARAKILGDIADLEAKLRKAKADLRAADGDTATAYVNVVYKYTGKGGRGPNAMAHGGVVGAASGGPRSRLTLVGEQGPELVDLAAGSTVHTANATRQILQNASSPAPAPMLITLKIGDQPLGELLIDPLRRAIRNRGGIVQATLGTGAA